MSASFAGVLGGGTRFVVVHGTVESHERVEFPTEDPPSTLSKITAWLSERQVQAIGLACFGPLDLIPGSPSYGRVLSTPKPGWSGANVLAPLRAIAPTLLQSDVGAAAIAEASDDASSLPLLYITVGTGIGAGLVTEHGVYHGANHPELGHLPAPREDEFDGICPFHGACIEGVASGPAIQSRTGLDPAALSDEHPVFNDVARALGSLMASATLGFAPREVVVGGGVMRHRATVRARAEQAMSDILAGYVSAPSVRAPRFAEPGAIGALMLAKSAGRG